MLKQTFVDDGHSYTFNIKNENDAIQKMHLQGKIFDVGELEVMASYIQDGDGIADIGTNVGNHCIYLAKHFPNSEITIFEPNAEAVEILRENLKSNPCANIDTQFLGAGLSDTATTAYSFRGGDNNLGGSRVVPKKDLSNLSENVRKRFNEIELLVGDDIFKDRPVKFMKIDVEGHEFVVLKGLHNTISTQRPKMFIEILNDNLDQFAEFISTYNYKIVWEDRHYKQVTNFMLLPI